MVVFLRYTLVSRYQNFSILDFIGAKDDGGDGDNWSYRRRANYQIVTTSRPTPVISSNMNSNNMQFINTIIVFIEIISSLV